MNKSRIGMGVGVLVGLFLLTGVLGSWYTVGPGQRGVLMTWHKVVPGVVEPGLHFKIPFMQSVEKMNVRVQNYASSESAASKDLQVVTTQVSVNFNLDPRNVYKFFTITGTARDFEINILKPAVANAVKVVTARYNAEDLVAERDNVRNGIEHEIRTALKPYNIDIDAINITNFAFSKEYSKAIERKQVAQQKALQATYDLKRVQISAQQEVAKAKANAKSTIINAQADAKALELKRKVLTPELIELQFIKHWNGKLPRYLTVGGSSGSPLPFLKLNQSK